MLVIYNLYSRVRPGHTHDALHCKEYQNNQENECDGRYHEDNKAYYCHDWKNDGFS